MALTEMVLSLQEYPYVFISVAMCKSLFIADMERPYITAVELDQ